ncbi:MAG: flavodoxin-dependent (E)-4-hydroxy-3-methylbut-2-enyl-diphosphate synthase [Actinobacteria bacterium]|nr:flavodoxin-dependent (E)-4-hydroxy-3-methylbut-2-enyl-diphosphate synthase [Actinomycetota bacterium]
MIIQRKKTREIRVGALKIGGDNPIFVQSMLKNKLAGNDAAKSEIIELMDNGCEIIRLAIPDKDAVYYLHNLIKNKIFKVPVVADIQFDYKLALECADAGVDCIRVNPGNIGTPEMLEKVVKKVKEKDIAIRIGINSGSIEKKILKKNKGDIVNSIVESTLENVRFMENLKFYNFKISAKASSVMETITIYEIISDKIDYPLHLGVTEAGPLFTGSIKSSVGLGILLAKGIGDTIRVSLTDRSVSEVKAAYTILKSLNLRKFGVNLTSCPTCGRTRVNLKNFVEKVEISTANIKENIKIAVMGCIVNGPGEAKDADIGIAFGKEQAAIFVKGKILKRVNKEKALDIFIEEILTSGMLQGDR